MKRAVFLDRDGTIIEDDGYISDVARIHLFPWSAEAISKLREAGFLIVVVTNQAGVARGLLRGSVRRGGASPPRRTPDRAGGGHRRVLLLSAPPGWRCRRHTRAPATAGSRHRA